MAVHFELDKWQVKHLYDLYKKGILNIKPEYQRSRVWSDPHRFELIDTVMHEWPMGLLMINVIPQVDEDNVPEDHYDVVDGQQRVRTLFEYIDGHEWGKRPPAKRLDFTPYKELSSSRQGRFDRYRAAVSLMYEYEEHEVLDVYSRLQRGKPLVIGEKVKALRTEFKPYIKELSEHAIFDVAGKRHKMRDAHWNLAALFFKSVYNDAPLGRQEYVHLEEFLKYAPFDERKANKALAETRKNLNYENKVIREAIAGDRTFETTVASARFMKWLYAVTFLLMRRYALSGKEHLVARGVHSYYRGKDKEGEDEWAAYVNTGRTGRIDTDDVRACLEQLMNRIVIATEAETLDPKRFFSPTERMEIFEKSKGKCAHCEIELSKTNFHADHIRPHAHGGSTSTKNGQALCSACNRKKGGDPELFSVKTRR